MRDRLPAAVQIGANIEFQPNVAMEKNRGVRLC